MDNNFFLDIKQKVFSFSFLQKNIFSRYSLYTHASHMAFDTSPLNL